ncbi:MAG TPA: YiiX/YebB-like N1pC/P60 family cysteine hydrolase [Thermoanaerobaculia bacterium]|nr:YiiX/YebB-like N1pC/P60 family cysteine hydrolase [Thermoanaerobaculia bacterium]
MRSPRRFLSDWFLEQITKPRRNYRRWIYNDPVRLKAAIKPGDVLLVEGEQRLSQAVKYLTTSTWSHSAIFIGDAYLKRHPEDRVRIYRRFGREARFLIVEALIDQGVTLSPLTKYIDLNVRICRPIGLRPEDLEIVLDHVLSRIGHTYDRRNFLELARYLLPFHLIPPKLKEDALHFGSGIETETICSTLLAEAFAKVNFPILPAYLPWKPRTVGERFKQMLVGRPTRRAWSGLLQARHPTLSVPRDFDLSPYFDVIKFNTGADAFDYRRLSGDGEKAAVPNAPPARPPAAEPPKRA